MFICFAKPSGEVETRPEPEGAVFANSLLPDRECGSDSPAGGLRLRGGIWICAAGRGKKLSMSRGYRERLDRLVDKLGVSTETSARGPDLPAAALRKS